MIRVIKKKTSPKRKCSRGKRTQSELQKVYNHPKRKMNISTLLESKKQLFSSYNTMLQLQANHYDHITQKKVQKMIKDQQRRQIKSSVVTPVEKPKAEEAE